MTNTSFWFEILEIVMCQHFYSSQRVGFEFNLFNVHHGELAMDHIIWPSWLWAKGDMMTCDNVLTSFSRFFLSAHEHICYRIFDASWLWHVPSLHSIEFCWEDPEIQSQARLAAVHIEFELTTIMTRSMYKCTVTHACACRSIDAMRYVRFRLHLYIYCSSKHVDLMMMWCICLLWTIQ